MAFHVDGLERHLELTDAAVHEAASLAIAATFVLEATGRTSVGQILLTPPQARVTVCRFPVPVCPAFRSYRRS